MSAGRDVVAFAGVGVGVLTTGAYLLTHPATCRGQIDYDSNRHSDGIQTSGERHCFHPETSASVQLHRHLDAIGEFHRDAGKVCACE
jgi:hypothetical protein